MNIEKSILYQKYGLRGVIIFTCIWFPLTYILLMLPAIFIFLLSKFFFLKIIAAVFALTGILLLIRMLILRVRFIRQESKSNRKNVE